MNPGVIKFGYLVAATLFILGIKGLSRAFEKTSQLASWLAKLTGWVFLLVGLYYLLVHLLMPLLRTVA